MHTTAIVINYKLFRRFQHTQKVFSLQKFEELEQKAVHSVSDYKEQSYKERC